MIDPCQSSCMDEPLESIRDSVSAIAAEGFPKNNLEAPPIRALLACGGDSSARGVQSNGDSGLFGNP